MDIANAVVFLASDEARYITGTELYSTPASHRRRYDRPVAGKVALITGAARGIGRAQAVRFAREGADIIALDVCGPVDTVVIPPADTRPTWTRPPDSSRNRRTDCLRDCRFRDSDPPRSNRPGCHGVRRPGHRLRDRGDHVAWVATETPENTWQTMLDVNLSGVWRTCKCHRAAPHRTGTGSMILVSSIAGMRGLVGWRLHIR